MIGVYDLNKKLLTINREGENVNLYRDAQYYEDDSVVSYFIGIDTYGQIIENVNIILNHPNSITQNFTNPYFLCLYRKDDKVLTLMTHPFGAPCNLYYIVENGKFKFATSLLELSNAVTSPFSLNKAALPQFIDKGFLSGTETLVENVNKLPAGNSLIITNGLIQLVPLKWYNPKDSAKEPETAYNSALDATVKDTVEANMSLDDGKLCMALSSGFDSNCLLFHIRRKYPDIKIQTFSIGGIQGVDETIQAERISKCYENTEFYKRIVTPDTLKCMDDIVFRLEGSVFERGIFLQYELSKLLCDHGVTQFVCGECSDEVFNRRTYDKYYRQLVHLGESSSFDVGSCLVLKKSILMLRSFGITGYYPFLNSTVLQMACAVRAQNADKKRFHKQQCMNMLPADVTNLMKHLGGTTDMAALFEKDFDYLDAIKTCKFYDPNYRFSPKLFSIGSIKMIIRVLQYGKGFYDKKLKDAMRKYYLTLLYIESFEKQFCEK